jgi:pSer/pThr/pTyr-binding forkhead associated (FHA) protein
MPVITLKFGNNPLGDYPLQKGNSMTIGRRQNNDLVIDNLAVSGHHAKIDSVGDGFVLIDLQSKNGSFVNEQLITSHWLKSGDVINIGKHSLVFHYTAGEEAPDDGDDEIEKTMIMDTSKYRTMVKKSKPHVPKPFGRRNGAKTMGLLTYLKGGEGKFKVRSKMIKIGKHRSSDLVIRGLFVARTAATISKRSDGYYLSYVGGFIKPRVNEKTVKQSVLLNDMDIIDIGSTRLQFFERQRHHSKNKSPKKKHADTP